jgi:nitrogen fixation protein NifB
LATNGLNLGPYIAELAELQVSHVTVTVNAVDPAIGARIYSWVRDGRVVYRGMQAAKLLLERQLDAIAALKAHDMIVKVNTILVPGINDGHVADVARRMAELRADIQNCMLMYPNAGTPFANISQPTPELMAELRTSLEGIIPQMKHCTRCRADAVGLLENDRSPEFRERLSACSRAPELITDGKPFVAVGTLEGVLVNQHLGEAERFQIWAKSCDGYEIVEERKAPAPGGGINRWLALAEILHDCRAVLVSGIGEIPRQVLAESQILAVEMNGFIKIGLDTVYNGGNMQAWRGRREGCAKGAGCSGDARGCA